MKQTIFLLSLLGLVACGVDGEPETPSKNTDPAPSVAITGRVEVGVAKSW